MVSEEMAHLATANAAILLMATTARALITDAQTMREGCGIPQGRSEAATAAYLGHAAINAVADMLALNLPTAASRADEFEVEMSGVADICGLLSAVPSETVRAELSEALRVISWALS